MHSCDVHVFSLALVDCELVRACTDVPGAKTRCTAPTFSDFLWPLSDPHPGMLRDGRLLIAGMLLRGGRGRRHASARRAWGRLIGELEDWRGPSRDSLQLLIVRCWRALTRESIVRCWRALTRALFSQALYWRGSFRSSIFSLARDW